MVKRIFLIDDDVDDREVFHAALSDLDYEFDYTDATDGEQALELINDKSFAKPDVIFLDLNMPKMGGLDFLRQLRTMPEYKNTKVIIYTTSSLEKDKEECFEAGADGFITKHYTFDALHDELKALFA